MKRFIALLFVLILIGSLAACAEGIPGYVKADKLKIYNSPSTSASVIGRMCVGDVLTVLNVKGSWCEVQNSSGSIGYCAKSGLSKDDPCADKCWISYPGTIAIHGENGEEMGTAWFGQCFTFLREEGGKTWVRNKKGRIGWFESSGITRQNPYRYMEPMYLQCPGNILYSKAQTKNGKRVKGNTPVLLRAYSDDQLWAIVEYNGKMYYTLCRLLNTEPVPEGGRIYASTTDQKVFAAQSWTSQTVGNLEKGDKVILLGVSGWGSKVQLSDGTVGYISAMPLEQAD